jgi:NAD(P)-binding Rossmann-like domain
MSAMGQSQESTVAGREIDTDYLVVGAGASGMAFVDALLAASDARVVIVDRRHRAGGHWLDAYPFVRLHQPSANYGVASRRLGADRLDDAGPNAGFYERATAGEICDYFARVLDDFVGSGRVQFLGMCDYLGGDGGDPGGYRVTSLLTGAETTIRARKLVDATYIESDIPSRHIPSFAVDAGVRLIPPNDLVTLAGAPRGFTVIGGGKTALDTCNWLLDYGVDPDRIQWIRPRDSWLFAREAIQPLELVGSYMQMQARWVRAAAEAKDGADFGRLLEKQDVFVRVDPGVEPEMFRGATISNLELAALRTVERVVRKGKVRGISSSSLLFEQGEVAAEPDTVYVDCTAAGLPPAAVRPVFAPESITLQYVTIGFASLSAATIGVVEATRDDDAEKNRLCPALTFTGNIRDVLDLANVGMTGIMVRSAESDLATWTDGCRLNPARGAAERFGEPQVADAFMVLAENIEPAMANLAQRSGSGAAPIGAA